MTIIELAPEKHEILDFIDDAFRQLQDAGAEAKFIVVGGEAYTLLRKAIGERFQRGAGRFETYQHVPIVLDPFRSDTVCVLPAPAECEKGVNPVRIES